MERKDLMFILLELLDDLIALAVLLEKSQAQTAHSWCVIVNYNTISIASAFLACFFPRSYHHLFHVNTRTHEVAQDAFSISGIAGTSGHPSSRSAFWPLVAATDRALAAGNRAR
jgi:hypothetical protein